MLGLTEIQWSILWKCIVLVWLILVLCTTKFLSKKKKEQKFEDYLHNHNENELEDQNTYRQQLKQADTKMNCPSDSNKD